MAEAVAAGAAVAAAFIQAKALWEPLRQTIESSNDMDEIYRALDEAMERLVARRKDHEVRAQRYKTTMTPSNTYLDWSQKVDAVAIEVGDLKARYTKERKRSRLFSINSRSKFTKKMKKTASRVFARLEEDTNFLDVLVDKKPACVIEMITSNITNIPTLQKPLEQTLGLLCDEKVRRIRIHGLVGSGKTTIMQNLNNHVKVAEMFKIVIWVKVSSEGSMENRGIVQIQQDIVERLKLDVGVTTNIDSIAHRIREELKDIKYLLLLDGVMEHLNLDTIGVPMSENGSKIVFTTRFQHVLSSNIATIQIDVGDLKPKEALQLFKSELNRPHLEKNPNIEKLMPKIVKWCGNLPGVIKVAAGVFRVKENEQSWQDGLRNLSKWPCKGDKDMQEIYRLLKCCFDCLEAAQKTCFFYTALYPEDSDIQKNCLLYNWAAEELLGTANEVEETLINGREILGDLIEVSLLMENASQRCILMHRLVRLAALFTLSTHEDEGKKSLVQFGESLKKHPDGIHWEDKRWISLVDSEMDALPAEPDCPLLSTLFLQKNPDLKAIPEYFFKHMGNLRALDLYGANITSLPCSLLELTTLKVLYLQKCVALKELPDIGKFQELEVLDIRGSGLERIPDQVKSLRCLRRLLVSISNSTSNGIEVIAEIPMLKELVIDVHLEQLQREIYGLIVKDVRLTSLSLLQFCSPNKVVDLVRAIGGRWEISFPTNELLQTYIRKEDSKLQKCQIFTGCDFSSRPPITDFKPYFKFDGGVNINAILQELNTDVAIELLNHNELEHLSSITAAANLNKIRSCVIEGCNKMRTIVDGNTRDSLILNKLEQLHMINLPVLKSIFEGPMQGLNSLKTLILSNCPMLTCVCTYDVILQLPEIRHLEVKGCSNIKEIFEESANAVSPVLPSLENLTLVDMPQLTSILVRYSFKWPSLERLEIHGCPQLKILPFQKDGALNLKSIEAEENWWEALENDMEVKKQLRPSCNWRS